MFLYPRGHAETVLWFSGVIRNHQMNDFAVRWASGGVIPLQRNAQMQKITFHISGRMFYLCVYLRAKELFKWLLSVNSFLVSETVGGATPPTVYCVSDVIRPLPVIGQEAGAYNMAAPSSQPSTWTPHLSSQSVRRCHPGWTGVKRRCLYSVCRSLADIQKWIYSISWWTSISVLCERYVNCQHRWSCKIHMYIYLSLKEYSFYGTFRYLKCHNIRSKCSRSEEWRQDLPVSHFCVRFGKGQTSLCISQFRNLPLKGRLLDRQRNNWDRLVKLVYGDANLQNSSLFYLSCWLPSERVVFISVYVG